MLTTFLIGFLILVCIGLGWAGLATFINFMEDYQCRCYKDYVKKWHRITMVQRAFVTLGALVILSVCLLLVFMFSLLLGAIVTGEIQ